MKRVEQKVLRFIQREKLIDAGDKILIAFSGGPDSVFVINFLNKFRSKFKINLSAVHFNHGLRGKESDEDEKFAKMYCEKKSICFVSKKLNVKSFAKKNKLSVEEAARSLRYKYLKKIAEETQCTKIATAHNQSDNTETILMNLFSGSGLSGLSGIPIQRENIIRPLLYLSKQEILDYLEQAKINYRIDSSNLSDDYKRNYIRNRILPLVKTKLNPAIDEALFRSSKNLANALSFNEKMAAYLVAQFVTHKKESASVWLYLTDIVSGEIPGEILKLVLKKYFNHEFESDDGIKINSLIYNQKGKQVQLTKNLIAVREEESIKIEHSKKLFNRPVEIKIGKPVIVNSKKVGIELIRNKDIKFGKNGKTEFISGDNLSGKFILREWRSGDKFRPLGMKNFKKVSDFLTDAKISASGRKNRLVLTNRNYIVWVVGLRIDDRFKLNLKTKKVYKLWVN